MRSPSPSRPSIPNSAPTLPGGFIADTPKRKVLCSCGTIAEVDLRMASTKMRLGKGLECRRCRNARIARERDEMDKIFSGVSEEEW